MLLKSGQKTPLDIIPLVNFESQMLKIIQCLILGYVCILSFESVCVRDIVISPPLTYWPHNHLNIYVCLYVMHILKYKYRVHIKSENNKTLNAIFYFSSRIIFLCVCVCVRINHIRIKYMYLSIGQWVFFLFHSGPSLHSCKPLVFIFK